MEKKYQAGSDEENEVLTSVLITFSKQKSFPWLTIHLHNSCLLGRLRGTSDELLCWSYD